MKIKSISWLFIFSIAMGYMESAIVIYLRKIYYPAGFHFPLVVLDVQIGAVELFREAATIFMLAAVGILSSKTLSLRFASFLFCFAVWDLFYYTFLWLLLGWPQSLFTFDILFLIPVPWVAPVIAPCIVSLTMMWLAVCIFYFDRTNANAGLKVKEWILFVLGSLVIIFSFMLDYLKYTFQINSFEISESLSPHEKILNEISNYVPAGFNWLLFFAGEVLILVGIIMLTGRMKKLHSAKPHV